MTPAELLESRLELGLSQKQIADKMGFGRGGRDRVSMYETDKLKPNKLYLNHFRLIKENYELKKIIIQLKAELETLNLKTH